MKAEFKHTPGPWKIFYPTVDDCGFGIDTADEKDSIVVMDTEAGIYSAATREQDLANAKLIAAAPELLTALQMALIEIKGAYSVTEWVNDDMEKMADEKVRMIEDAIKKATDS